MSFMQFFKGRFGWAGAGIILSVEGANLAVSTVMGLSTGADRLNAGSDSSWPAVLAQETAKHWALNHVRVAQWLMSDANAAQLDDNTQLYFHVDKENNKLRVMAIDPEKKLVTSFSKSVVNVPPEIAGLQGATVGKLRRQQQLEKQIGTAVEPRKFEQDGYA